MYRQVDPILRIHSLSQPSLLDKFQDNESLCQKPRSMTSEKLYLKLSNCPTYTPAYKNKQLPSKKNNSFKIPESKFF